MIRTLIAFAMASACFAQAPSPVYCKTTLLNSVNMKGLYGGRVAMFQARTTCKNMGTSDAPIDGPTLDLSMPTINSMPSTSASAMLTKTYQNQKGQKAARDASIGLGLLGILQAGKYAILSAGPFGVVVGIVMAATQYIIPMFTAGEPPLDLSNQCDLMTNVVLKAGQSAFCTTYIQKPAKTDSPLPGAFTFYLVNPGALPPAGPPPPNGPVRATPPHAEIQPDTTVPPAQVKRLGAFTRIFHRATPHQALAKSMEPSFVPPDRVRPVVAMSTAWRLPPANQWEVNGAAMVGWPAEGV